MPPTDRELIKQLRQRVDELTGELEDVASERLRLQVERGELQKARDALIEELAAAKRELEQIRTERPALTFDQLGAQMREGLAAVDAAGAPDGPRYGVRTASFDLKVAVESDGERALLRLPSLGEAVDPRLLATFQLELSPGTHGEPDLTGLVLVPSVLEATGAGAETRLGRSGLSLGKVSERPAFAAPGVVVEQDPDGGTYVEPGTAIDIVLAATEIAVPDLSGLSADRAAERLASVRLTLGSVSLSTSEATSGTVISQDPSPGEVVAVGSDVAIELASPPLREVPDLVGLTIQDAGAKLQAAELALGRADQRVSPEKAGTIIEQRPAAGDHAERGSVVSVVVAKAPVRRAVPVPDVVSLSHDKAIEALRGSDFGATVIGTVPFSDGADPSSFDSVAEQRPGAGTPSTAIEVQLTIIASGAPVAQVDGVGRALAARLASAGLPTVGDLAHSDPERIRAAIGGSLERAAKLRAAAVEINRPPR